MRSLHVIEFVRHEGVWNLPEPLVRSLEPRFPTVRFSTPVSREDAMALLPEAEVTIGWLVRPDNFSLAQRLEWVHLTAAGVGPILFPEMVASPVVVTNSRGLHAMSMAEHALGVLLSFARKLHLARDAQFERRWTQSELWTTPPPFADLGGSTLGLVGLGAVGSAIAERARALGMRVLAVRRRPASDPLPAHEQWPIERLDDLLAAADWIVLAAPSTPRTRGVIGRRELALMKPEAVLVNLGRGDLIDEPALIEALQQRRLAGAGLDVFVDEPLAPESPLWSNPNVLLTPHISGLGPRYWERALEIFATNLERHLAGKPLVNVVDKNAGY